jgi:hypothetical protein
VDNYWIGTIKLTLGGQVHPTQHAWLGVQDHILDAINPLTLCPDHIEYVTAIPEFGTRLGQAKDALKPLWCTDAFRTWFDTAVAQ